MKEIRKNAVLIICIFMISCLAGRVELNRHPDYRFEPTNRNALTIYEGFLPQKEFIIIGQITVTQKALSSAAKTRELVYNKAAQIGGDAILVSHSEVRWMNYNRAVTTGTANVYNYGYSMSGTWRQTTTAIQTPVPVARYYYLYVLRWKNREDAKDVKVGDAVPVTTSPFNAQARGLFTPAMAQSELQEIEDLFFQGKYNEAASKLARLKQSIDQATRFNNRNKYLAEVHFLWGAYYAIVDKPTIAKEHFEITLEHEPEFMFNPSQFSGKIVELFEQVKGGPIEVVTKDERVVRETLETGGEDTDQAFLRGSQVRVVKDNAILRVEPDEKSLSIRKLPLGALLAVDGKVGDWIKIKLPPDSDRITVMGYIHYSFLKPVIE